ncbi:MAG: FAD-dependent oxidoreductase [Thermoguttaceae bacterium]
MLSIYATAQHSHSRRSGIQDRLRDSLPALLVKDMENLLVVGRAVSASHMAQSAVRVQPIVSQMGQAAGTAAALAVANRTSLRSIDIPRLQ